MHIKTYLLKKYNNKCSKCGWGEKNIYTNKKQIITLTRCTCSVVCDKANKKEACKNNNDLYITPDGKISLCRKIEDEIDILVQTKDKNNEELILRLDTALKQMGSSCKY